MSFHGRRRGRGALALAAFAVTVSVPAPASAHPFGDPQTVTVARDEQRPEVVHVQWRVGGPDDLTLLGVSLGLLPQDRVLLDGAVDYRYTDPAVIGASDRFAAYLLQQITVADGGQACTGVVEPPKALGLKGATVDYTCPGPVDTVTVGVRMLTDLNPAYRTLATGPEGQRAVYDSSAQSHDWVLDGRAAPATTTGGLARSAAVQIGGVAGGVLVAVVAILIVSRRLRRRRIVA